ncbi:hypothetical protein ACH5RR_009111 [Cinchona calisaya]|uniref:Replication factor A C-terminal domain-containing protein n=1 Tax=Cinchona calisaya TaxID=153742 RepID=A0ABD3AF18_9GENT
MWVKAQANIANADQKLYVLTSPNCLKLFGAKIDVDFTCLHCNMPAPKPHPRARLYILIKDATRMINAQIEDKYAEFVLGVTAEEMIQMEVQAEQKIGETSHTNDDSDIHNMTPADEDTLVPSSRESIKVTGKRPTAIEQTTKTRNMEND